MNSPGPLVALVSSAISNDALGIYFISTLTGFEEAISRSPEPPVAPAARASEDATWSIFAAHVVSMMIPSTFSVQSVNLNLHVDDHAND